jgi:hypothetical protein
LPVTIATTCASCSGDRVGVGVGVGVGLGDGDVLADEADDDDAEDDGAAEGSCALPHPASSRQSRATPAVLVMMEPP